MAFVLRPPGSRESLTDNLADLGRFRKRVAVTRGMFAFVGIVVGCAGLACVLDSMFHLPPLARAFALVATLALGGVFWIRGVSRALALRTDALSVALELEDKYPKLNDSLASAVSFLEAGDAEPRGISNRLQDAAVKQAKRLADRHDFDHLAPTGSLWRAGWACGIVLAVAIPTALATGARATTAVMRLADPFGAHPWPTKTRVEILIPETLPLRMPRGDAFVLKFAVRGVIKEHAILTVRITGGEEFHEEFPLSPGNDSRYGSSTAIVSTRIDAGRVTSAFSFKIASNDYDGEWQQVDVVPPPRLVPIGNRPSPQFTVTPPTYTGLPTLDLPDGATVLEIPAGTAVRMRAATDVPIVKASIVFLGDRVPLTAPAGFVHVGHLNPFGALGVAALGAEIACDIPVSLDSTGTRLAAHFTPSATGTYALRLTDETGLTGTRILEFRLTPDPAPTVAMLRPSLGRDPAVLTPTATVFVHVASDDKLYAVRRTFIEYRVGRDGTVRVLPLHDVEAVTRTLPVVAGGPVAATRAPRPTSANTQLRTVPVAAFTRADGSPLKDGDTLFVRGAGDDWDDLTPGKEPGRSDEIEIRIASPEGIEAWLQRELATMRPELFRLRDQQRETRQKAGEVIPQADGTLSAADRDRLLSAEQAQRLVRGKITDAQDGLRAKAEILRETVLANKLPRSNTTDRVVVVADELGRLSDRDFPVIEPSLADARQLGGQPPRTGQEKAVPDLLKKAGRHQKNVEDGLTDLLDLLSVWGGAGEIRGEARLLRDFILRQANDIEKMDKVVPASELDRTGTRAEQAASQASQLLSHAGARVEALTKRATELAGGVNRKTGQAAALRAEAAALPPGAPDKSRLNAEAAQLEVDAEDLKAQVRKTVAEAEALRKGIQAAGGQDLQNELNAAGAAARKDNRFQADKLLRSSAGRLDRMIEELTEKPGDTAPDLKKTKRAADDLNTLADAQDDIRRRSAEAAKVTDPAKRAAELQKLAAEQEKLIERSKDVLQRLNRDGATSAARDLRAAIDHMGTARTDLENGSPGIRPQNDAVEKLEGGRDQLDAATVAAPQQLSDEARRKMAEKVKAVLEKQKAAIGEAERIHKLVAKEMKWSQVALTEYADIALFREDAIAKEVRALEKDFAPLPVLARVLNESATEMEKAATRITGRVRDVDPALAFDAVLETASDRKVTRPMALAARRLEQLLDALKQDDPKKGDKKGTPPKAPGGGSGGNGGSGAGGGSRQQDLVPPLAQLKVLRALQAELNERTAEFAKEHPDLTKVTDDDLRKELEDELKELEQAQRDIAALFQEMAKLFEQEKGEKPDAPEKNEKPNPPNPEKP